MTRTLTSRFVISVLCILFVSIATLLFFAPEPRALPLSELDLVTSAETIERGRYLADAGNCANCHTSEGGASYAGGVPFETPFGTIYSTNITPDLETGIGTWSKAAFRRAMHEGVAADGSRLFPAYPYPSFTKIANDDISAMYAYLRTLAPIESKPPRNSFLLRQRWSLKLWNMMYFDEGRLVPSENRSIEWNRGAYLIQGLGHCSACHTPRNHFMAEIPERFLHGGTMRHEVEEGKLRDWFAVDLTPSRSGLGSWSEKEIAQYLGTGFSKRAGTFGPMNEVIVESLMKLNREDINAMAQYLTSLPPRELTDTDISGAQAKLGKPIYDERCEKCHGASGRGGIFDGPPLAGSAIVQAENPASLINVILYGPDIPDEVSFGAWETMKKYGHLLDDAEIADVSNYVRGSWGNAGRLVTEDDVAHQR